MTINVTCDYNKRFCILLLGDIARTKSFFMDIQKIPRGELERYCRTKFSELGMSDSLIHSHILAIRHLATFMEANDFKDYTEELGAQYKEYVDSIQQDLSPYHLYNAHLVIRRLNDSLKNEYHSHPGVRPRRFKMIGEIGKIGLQYLDYKKKRERIAAPTIRKAEIILGEFSMYCESRSKSFKNITRDFLVQYIDCKRKTCYSGLHVVGNFLNYVYENQYIDTDYSELFKNQKKPIPEKLMLPYNPEEVKQIENSIDRSTPIGKMKYAMILLASRLGLRSSDIANLKLENIDWDGCLIQLKQYKTKKIVELPLMEDIGMALIDYLKYARPSVKYDNVFITKQQPYRPVKSLNVGNLIRSVINESGVVCNGRSMGPHSLRHSLATILINKGTGLPVISEVLGHSSTQSTMTYIAVNVNSLLECSLEVPMVDNNFYLQKGGAFYG